MSALGNSASSLRVERLELTRLGWAFAISLAIHLLCWGVYSGGQKLHLWDRIHVPAWLQKLAQPVNKVLKIEPKPLFQETEPPLMFVNVNPDTATPEPPEKPKFYSNLNSKAANPQADKDSEIPKLAGDQEFVPETETVPRNQFDRLQPTPPAQPPQPEEHAKSKPKEAPGDLALAKPETNLRPNPGEGEKERPRRLSQVNPNKANRLPSRMIKQAGGVGNIQPDSSLDTKSTVTGNYDWLFIQSVKARWFDLLEDRDYAVDRGYVRLKFKLHYDGRITDMEVLENKVSETLSLICQKAVLDPQPFEKWTKEMRLVIGKDYRDITFTFYYY